MPKTFQHGSSVIFDCPGCEYKHILNVDGDFQPRWTFNGDHDSPTITPSILNKRAYGGNRERQVCHSFVAEGMIRFLPDSTHSLAGQTVPLPDVKEFLDA